MSLNPSGPRAPADARPQALPQTVETPTLLVAALIYGGWILLTLLHARMPLLLEALVGGWLGAWHGSLQHEVIHGHPTPWRRVNTVLAVLPMTLWLPFELYRDSHLQHHATEHLTLPGQDPESRYLAPGQARARTTIEAVQATLLGRLLLGPVVGVAGFLTVEARAVIGGEPGRRRAWAAHLALVALVLAWVLGVCGMSLGEYLLVFVYPSAALTLVRSFAEHRADADPGRRIAVVEGAPILGLLFLNNNLHALHHARPGLAWHRLPGVYARDREQILRANGGLVYDGYREVFTRFLLRPHDRLVHPSLGAEP